MAMNLPTNKGDWEMMQIILDEDENPQKAGYSQHYGGDKRSWSNVNKVDRTHPKVYVALDGHGCFYTENLVPLTPDQRGYFGEEHTYRNETDANNEYKVQMISNQDWLNFKGRWGKHDWPGPSPEGPVFRNTGHWTSPTVPEAYMWIEAIYWQSVVG